MTQEYTPQQITEILINEFAASLILTTLGFIIYGINIAQFANYLWLFRSRDQLLTRVWVITMMIFNTASTFYQVYSDWTLSIIGFTVGNGKIPSAVSGNGVVLYSVVVLLTQLFWIGCIQRMMMSNPRLSWLITVSIGVLSVAAFSASIAVGVFSITEGPFEGLWPLEKTAMALRVTLSCALGADAAILVVFISQLAIIKRKSIHLKKTVSRLSYIFFGVTTFSTLLIIAEIIFQYPHEDGGVYTGVAGVTISFSPLIPPVYAFSMLSILNARTNLWSIKRRSRSETDGKGLIPGMNFTVDLPQQAESTTRDIPLTTSAISAPHGVRETDSFSGSIEDKR